MDNQLFGYIGTFAVAFFFLFIFIIGVVTIYKSLKAINQNRTGQYITIKQADAINEQNASLATAMKAINKKLT